MTDHPAASLIEQLALGALDDEEIVAHCAHCDACAAKLAREARLELALGELHAYRSAHRFFAPRRLLTHVAPVVLVAAAAVLLLFVRRAPHPQAVGEPALAPITSGSAAAPSNADEVIAARRHAFKACLNRTVGRGSASGKVVLAITTSPEGAVRDVVVESNEGLSADVATCLADAVRTTHFKGTGMTTTFRFPIQFTVQN